MSKRLNAPHKDDCRYCEGFGFVTDPVLLRPIPCNCNEDEVEQEYGIKSRSRGTLTSEFLEEIDE